MGRETDQDLTELLSRLGVENDSPSARLLPLVYRKLRSLAGSYFKREAANHTLQPTALVHEAFLKLSGSANQNWRNRAHFFSVAALAMRQILCNHARDKHAKKRGGDGDNRRVTLSDLPTPHEHKSEIDVLDLEQALSKLEELSSRKARIVEMRFLAGLNNHEIAEVLEVSQSTVEREWRVARAFLKSELSGDAPS